MMVIQSSSDPYPARYDTEKDWRVTVLLPCCQTIPRVLCLSTCCTGESNKVSEGYVRNLPSAVSSVIELSRGYLGQGCVDLAVKIRVRMEK